ncbi:MAG: hypothetical protein AAFQ40_08310 [Cyanobacteria bacterium J06623_5]
MTTLKERKPDTAIVTTSAVRPKASRLRKIGTAIARHPRLIQVAVLLILTSGVGVFLFWLLFKGAWSPEKDNVTVLRTIFKMEFERQDTLPITDGNADETAEAPVTDGQVVTRSYETLDPYVEEAGWTWVNRFGSTLTYGKDEQRLIASCSPYSPLYLICSLSEIP